MFCWSLMCSVHCRKTTTGLKAMTRATPASAFLSAPSRGRATRWPGSAPAKEGSSAGSAIAVTTTLLRSPHLDAKVWLFQMFHRRECGRQWHDLKWKKGLDFKMVIAMCDKIISYILYIIIIVIILLDISWAYHSNKTVNDVGAGFE